MHKMHPECIVRYFSCLPVWLLRSLATGNLFEWFSIIFVTAYCGQELRLLDEKEKA